MTGLSMYSTAILFACPRGKKHTCCMSGTTPDMACFFPSDSGHVFQVPLKSFDHRLHIHPPTDKTTHYVQLLRLVICCLILHITLQGNICDSIDGKAFPRLFDCRIRHGQGIRQPLCLVLLLHPPRKKNEASRVHIIHRRRK